MSWLPWVLVGTHLFAAVVGMLYEGCRRGGSVDLRAQVATQPPPLTVRLHADVQPFADVMARTAKAARFAQGRQS